jgi:hypothetical protein
VALEFVEGCARLAVVGTYRNTNWANIFHWKRFDDNGFEQAEIDQLVTEFRTFYVSALMARVSNQVNMTSVTGTDLTNILGVVGIDNTPAVGVLNTVAVHPGSVAMVISWKIARHYRGGHPRTYLTGQPHGAEIDGKSWSPAHTAAGAAAASNFLISVNGIELGAGEVGGELVCVHRQLGGAKLIPPVTSPIVNAVVDNRIDSQRRRLGPDVNG